MQFTRDCGAGTAYGRRRVRGWPTAFRLQRRASDARAAARGQHTGTRRRRRARRHATRQVHQVQAAACSDLAVMQPANCCSLCCQPPCFISRVLCPRQVWPVRSSRAIVSNTRIASPRHAAQCGGVCVAMPCIVKPAAGAKRHASIFAFRKRR